MRRGCSILLLTALLAARPALAAEDPEVGPDEALRQARAEAGNSVFNAVLMGTPGLTLHLGYDLGLGLLDERVGPSFAEAWSEAHVLHRLHVGISAARLAALPLAWLGSFSSEDVLSTRRGLAGTLFALGLTDLGLGAVDLVGAGMTRRRLQTLPGGDDADGLAASAALLGVSGAIQIGLGLVELFSAMGVTAEADDASGVRESEWRGTRFTVSPFGAGALVRVEFPAGGR